MRRRSIAVTPSLQRNLRPQAKFKMKLPLFLALLLVSFCGFGWQAFHLSATYFAFEVVSDVSIEFGETFEYPTPSLCFYLTDLFDWERVSREPDLKKYFAI